jgi:hypothetical protein
VLHRPEVLVVSGDARVAAELRKELDVAEAKAWESLARYKFQMFGYWAAIWVHLNRIGGFKRPNPWAGLVKAARDRGPGGSSSGPEEAPLFAVAAE